MRIANDEIDLQYPGPADQRSHIKLRQPINITAGKFFMRYPEKARTIRIIGACEDESGRKQILPHYLTDDELGPEALMRYEGTKDAIEQDRINLVGHSARGWIVGIYPGEQLYAVHRVDRDRPNVWSGHRQVATLLTLVTPHISQERWTRLNL